MGTFFAKVIPVQTDYTNDEQDKKTLEMLTQYHYYTQEQINNMATLKQCRATLDYTNLIFEGGGVKGLAYAGAIKYLEEINLLSKIKNFGGSSAGAIIACLLALGYNSEELKNIMEDTDFGSFIDDSIFITENIYKLIENFGIASGNVFENFIEKYIKNKTGNPNYTFKNLYDDKQITLVTTGTNLNRQMTVYFHKDSFPNMPIKRAVRISMSVPGLFEPVKCALFDIDDLYIDGGCTDNYPLHIFDGKYIGDPQAALNLVDPNPKTLGFKLVTSDEENNMIVQKRQNIKNIKDVLSNLINTFMTNNERKLMSPSYFFRTICIDVPNIPLTKFSIDNATKNTMNMNGYNCTKKFFECTINNK